MAHRRVPHFAPGETLVACSICGFPYCFPSELVLADDRKLYCKRTCWKGETVQGHNDKRAAWRPPEEQEPPAIGTKPSWR